MVRSFKNEQYISFGDSLFLSQTSDGTPKSFYQHYSTGVCFDNQCRPLDIILHWSISGRYLGFEMPKGEFLSKTDHDPFTRKEYLQLNEILSNADLPFKDIKYHELMNQPESSIESVDAISGATSERIKRYCGKKRGLYHLQALETGLWRKSEIHRAVH